MKVRQAKKIVKSNLILCRSRIDGPQDVVTGGRVPHPEHRYRKALLILIRRMERK